MADTDVVIVDDEGNDHVFPPNFDPKRAASIVRQQTYKPGKLATHALSGDPGGYPEGVDPTQSVTSRIGHALQPLAHPQTTGDILSLLLPAGAGEAIGAARSMVRGYMSAGARAMEGAPNLRSMPGRMLKTLYQDATVGRTPNPLARMGQASSIPAGAVSGPSMPSGLPEPFGVRTPIENPLGSMGQGPTSPAARISGRMIPNGPPEPFGVSQPPNPLGHTRPYQLSDAPPVTAGPPSRPAIGGTFGTPVNKYPDQKVLNELAIHARRAGLQSLTGEEYQALTTLVSEGATPADAIAALARIR